MLVAPRPGVNREHLLNSLTDLHTSVFNLRGGRTGTAYDRLLDYLSWANDAVVSLSRQISGRDLDRLVLTKRYELLLLGLSTLAGTDTQRVVNGLVSDDEIVDRASAIKPLVGRDVTLLTYDTSQASRGRQADLKVRKLSQPIEEAT